MNNKQIDLCTSELVKIKKTIYLACDNSIADDISHKLKNAIDTIDYLRKTNTDLTNYIDLLVGNITIPKL
jgi:hypothetical protein